MVQFTGPGSRLSRDVSSADFSCSPSGGSPYWVPGISNDSGRPDFHFPEPSSKPTQNFPSESALMGPTFAPKMRGSSVETHTVLVRSSSSPAIRLPFSSEYVVSLPSFQPASPFVV